MLGQYCPDIADAIHEEFEYVTTYTNMMVGGKQVHSTMPLRRSLQIYVLRLFGVILDDFNYNRLNYYLTLMHKVFIKKLVCFPETILRVDVSRVVEYDEFCAQDLVHYIAISTQVRRIMELQYIVHVFQQYQSKAFDGELDDDD